MKKIFLILSILFTAVFVVSCQDKTTYIVKGKVNNVADGTKVYLYDDLYRKNIVDSATIKDNKFAFEGKLEKPVMRNLKVEGTGLKQEDIAEGMDVDDIAYISTLFVLESGKTINLLVDNKGYFTTRGSSLTQKHVTFWSELSATGAPDSDGIVNMIKENKDDAIGLFYFSNIIEFVWPDSKTLKELYPLFSDKYRENKNLDEVLDYIANLDNMAPVGTKYIDIQAKTPDRQNIALSDYVGKKDVVLLHFFKWSGLVSDKDYTYLRNAYAKYKDKGFEIVGIWLDPDKETWKEILEEDSLTWPQMQDTKQINQIIKTYALFDEPRTILIDKEGTIVDREIPRNELDVRLSKLLK
ncbi:MAG: AhpC/TSA family protein [Prevotella sp.]|nr:AhpC/TSA family protein [Prevotella sp.]